MSESPENSEELFFTSHNESCDENIVLLHGLFSCHLEWTHVIPHLSTYHLLIPDLLAHSQSSHLTPFSLPLAVSSLASLIKTHAHKSRAHLVGLSLGGFITLSLITYYPDLVSSAFISGCTLFTPWQIFFARRPTLIHWGLWLSVKSGLYRVAEKMVGLREHEALKVQAERNNTYELTREGYGALVEWGEQDVRVAAENGRKRVCVVAGDHGDDVEGARSMGEVLGEVLGEGEGRCRAVMVKEAIHGWNLQFPELFARGILSWVKGREMPEAFIELESGE